MGWKFYGMVAHGLSCIPALPKIAELIASSQMLVFEVECDIGLDVTNIEERKEAIAALRIGGDPAGGLAAPLGIEEIELAIISRCLIDGEDFRICQEWVGLIIE